MKIILLNGPPSSGKDTAAKHIYSKLHTNTAGVLFERFSAPLKTAFAAITGKTYNHYYEVAWYEEHKEKIIPWLGVSYRQWQIDFSEKFMKKYYGDDIFGKLFVERIMAKQMSATNPYKVAVVPDSGFDIEIEYLEKHLNIDDILLIRCHRDGYDFSKDSRNYVYSKHFMSLDVNNNESQELFEEKMEVIYNNFVHNQGKMLKNGGWY